MPPPLTDHERAVYAWQIDVDGHGERGQQALKDATVMVSRCGGLGGVVAYELAAAGVGRLVVAHGGDVKPSDLNRQLLMTEDWLGKPRIASVERRLRQLNPRLEVVAEPANVSAENVARLVGQSDVVVDCAPLFAERFLMNRECLRQGKPMVEAAMFDLQCQLTTIVPGATACLRCIYPEDPSGWRRRFPVFGAVSGSVGSMAAMEAIKLLTGLGRTLRDRLLVYDLRDLDFRVLPITRRGDCPDCGT